MTKDQVIHLRDEINKKSNGLVITTDNMMVFSTSIELIIFDDDNEYFHCIRPSVNHYTQDQAPVEIISTTYEHIQYISGYLTTNNLEEILDEQFVGTSLIKEETKEKFLKHIRSLQNHVL